MIQENKYYTPTIGELIETIVNNGEVFVIMHGSDTLVRLDFPEPLEDSLKSFIQGHSNIKTTGVGSVYILNLDLYRVKYLDRESIESLGFLFEGGVLIKNYKDKFIYKVDDYKQYNLDYTYSNNIMRLNVEDLHYFEENTNYLFQGIIKNKSELKIILKQIGVL